MPSKRSSKSSKSSNKCTSGAASSRKSAIAKTKPVTSESWGCGSASGDFHRGPCQSGSHMITTESTRDGQVFSWVSVNTSGDYIIR